jgi:asparagine synthase (glutamine-hydrolysing)
MMVKKRNLKIERYWDPDFTQSEDIHSEERYAQELRELLVDATRLQLRADVPVGAYLSGGIDSSVITALIKNFTDTPLRTFSVTFDDEAFDESSYQRQMIDHLETDHSEIRCTYSDIGSIFPDVIWHTEKPIVRTAPAPLFMLSKLVRKSGYKVVLTGEGSDEIMAGYDIFKEVKVRRFLERCPDSKFRPLILKRLYPYLTHSPVKSVPYAEAFFKSDNSAYPDECYSHVPRWNTTSKIKTFFSDSMKETLIDYNAASELSPLLSRVDGYDDVSLAQYVEMKTLLSGYLLSSQGDRVAMAHSIEGRFPFLDHRVIEFCCKLPPTVRMRVLTEKYILKESMKDLLPKSILKRSKQPYRAPDSQSFFRGNPPDYIGELLSDSNLKTTGYFNAKAVSALVRKCRQNSVLGFKDNMAVVGIISTLLLHDRFIEHFDAGKGIATTEKMEGHHHVANT